MTVIEWVTLATSLTGMATGIAGLTLSIVNFSRDRARLLMTVQPNMNVMNVAGYDAAKTYVATTVTNIGRRPLYLNMVAMLTSNGENALINDGLHNPRKVDEGDPPSQYLTGQDYLEEHKDIWPGICFVVRAADGSQAYCFLREKPSGFPDVKHHWLLRLRTRRNFRWAFKRVHRPR